MSYSIRPNIPDPTAKPDRRGKGIGYFWSRNPHANKEAEVIETPKPKKVKKQPIPEIASAALEAERQKYINIGKQHSRQYLGLTFNNDNDIVVPSVLKFQVEEAAVEATQNLDNWCSKTKHSESDLFGFDYPKQINSMRIKSKSMIDDYSVPLPKYYHITNGKLGGYYEADNLENIKTILPVIQYHRIDPIHIESEHTIQMKEYSLNMKLNHLAYSSDKFMKEVAKMGRYDLEILLSNLTTKFNKTINYQFSGVKKHLIIYCHDRVKMMETYIKYKSLFYDINQLFWKTNKVDEFVKISYYAHSRKDWNILNNYYQDLFFKNFNSFDQRIILAQHPEHVPKDLRFLSDEIIINFIDGNDAGISLLDYEIKRYLTKIKGRYYRVNLTLDDFASFCISYASEKDILFNK